MGAPPPYPRPYPRIASRCSRWGPGLPLPIRPPLATHRFAMLQVGPRFASSDSTHASLRDESSSLGSEDIRIGAGSDELRGVARKAHHAAPSLDMDAHLFTPCDLFVRPKHHD